MTLKNRRVGDGFLLKSGIEEIPGLTNRLRSDGRKEDSLTLPVFIKAGAGYPASNLLPDSSSDE